MIEVSASLLAADFSRLESEILRMKEAGADSIHFDMMDGRFVPEISFGEVVLGWLTGYGIPFHAHLMTENPLRQLAPLVKAGASSVTVHAETVDVRDAVNAIHASGLAAGVSVKPGTPVEVLLPVLDTADRFLIMTVEPGYGGQAMMPEMLDKVRTLADLAKVAGRSPVIEIDGGVNRMNTAAAAASGLNSLVIGSALFGADDPKGFITMVHAL